MLEKFEAHKRTVPLGVLIVCIIMIFTFCSCRKANEDGSGESSQMNFISSQVTSSEDEDVSSENSESSSKIAVSGEVSSNGNHAAAVSENPSPVVQSTGGAAATPAKEPISFKPKEFSVSPGSSEKTISKWNITDYKGKKYALSYGESGGAFCNAIVTLDANENYTGCIALCKDFGTNTFAIYHDRFYLTKHKAIDTSSREQQSFDRITIYSIDLNGNGYRQEADVLGSFSKVGENSAYASDGNWFIWIEESAAGMQLYRYNINSKQSTRLGEREYGMNEDDDPFFVKNGMIYRFSENKMYSYDFQYENRKELCDYSSRSYGRYPQIEEAENGFYLTFTYIYSRIFVDLNGNVS